ncbi:hypothetical protein FHP25_23090 [Vineibacter terrae]|uniref:Uncharacterized protein n=1 Tax=Vineibacter terrae TaxID=2586908 RepID=A0A5C8PGY8_9HYPH|nr:hypothetical protein FHP25_23090 [Vineibacter terrae]
MRGWSWDTEGDVSEDRRSVFRACQFCFRCCRRKRCIST